MSIKQKQNEKKQVPTILQHPHAPSHTLPFFFKVQAPRGT
jgi:hypothetical protein